VKITITIPDGIDVMQDVTEYCRKNRIDLHSRMQQELDDFVSKVRELVRQERLVNSGLDEITDTFKKAVEGEVK